MQPQARFLVLTGGGPVAEDLLPRGHRIRVFSKPYDPLTGVANRSLFRQHVARAAAFAKRSHGRFAALVLDLDRFKFINDSLGHDAGDAFLQEVAHRLQVAVRDTDTVARLGGDEFAVLATPMTAPEDIEPLSERILAELRRPIELNGTRVQPTASIGAAIFPDSGKDSDALLSAADAAMYVVKESHGVAAHASGQRPRNLEGPMVLIKRRRTNSSRHYCAPCRPLGTTLVAVLVLNNHAFIVSVGDSRAYLLREGDFEQLTRDHNVYNELIRRKKLRPEAIKQVAPKSALTRAVGRRGVLDRERQCAGRQGQYHRRRHDGRQGG